MPTAKAPFDLAAFVAASAVGGFVFLAWGFLSGLSVVSSVAFLILLFPFLGLASAFGIGLFVVPTWFVLGRSRFGAPAPFSAVVGLVCFIFGSVANLWYGLSPSEVLSGSVFPLVWCCTVAATYSGWARAGLAPLPGPPLL